VQGSTIASKGLRWCVKTIRVHLQYGKFAWLRRKDWEEEETNDKASDCGEVASTENEKTVPSTHCCIDQLRPNGNLLTMMVHCWEIATPSTGRQLSMSVDDRRYMRSSRQFKAERTTAKGTTYKRTSPPPLLFWLGQAVGHRKAHGSVAVHSHLFQMDSMRRASTE
jgi:hypothetical protein